MAPLSHFESLPHWQWQFEDIIFRISEIFGEINEKTEHGFWQHPNYRCNDGYQHMYDFTPLFYSV